VIDSECTSSLD